MAIRLRQSTASQEIPLGYFVDSLDGNTEETALSIANTDIKLWKMGATSLASKNSGGATHMANGLYYCVLDATDTNTLGGMVVFVHVSGALAVRVECEVLPAVVYDSLIAGSDRLQVHVDEMTAGIITAAVIATGAVDADAIATDAVTEIQSGLATASALSTVSGYVDDLEGRLTATRAGYLDNLSGGAVATASALSTVSGYVDDLEGRLTATRAGYLDNLSGGAVATASALSTVAGYVDTEVAAIKAKTDLIPASPAAVGSAMTLAADAVNSSSLAASAVAEIQAGLSTLTAGDVNAQMVDVLVTDTYGEPSGVPAATSSLKDKINWLFVLARNKRLTTATADKVRNDGDSGDVGTAVLSDDGSTFTRGEYA